MRKFLQGLRDDSLSIVLFALFVAALVGQTFAGWESQNETLAAHHLSPQGYGAYLLSGSFWEGLAVNWQAAVLQLASLILFSGFLYQRGAPHSRNPRKPRHKARHKKRSTWIKDNSLSLAFLLMFLLTLVAHALSGDAAYNEQRSLLHQKAVSLPEFLISAKFWSATLETWQAEYLVITIYVVASIFLRQQNSAESKSVGASNQQTGKANE